MTKEERAERIARLREKTRAAGLENVPVSQIPGANPPIDVMTFVNNQNTLLDLILKLANAVTKIAEGDKLSSVDQLMDFSKALRTHWAETNNMVMNAMEAAVDKALTEKSGE